MVSNKVIRISIENQSVDIGFNGEDSQALAEFLVCDLKKKDSHLPVKARYDIVSSGNKKKLSLWEGEKRHYFGQSRFQLSYILINKIIQKVIEDNYTHFALHSACVTLGEQCIILPGVSGSGKSSLTAWLLTNGYKYLTDELIFLDKSGVVTPFTRPISLKTQLSESFLPITSHQKKSILSSKEGLMIPHRLLNTEYERSNPTVTHIVFPKFTPQSPTQLNHLTPGKSISILLESFVNSRNHRDLGIHHLAQIVRNCTSYQLQYGSFDELPQTFESVLSRQKTNATTLC